MVTKVARVWVDCPNKSEGKANYLIQYSDLEGHTLIESARTRKAVADKVAKRIIRGWLR